jgi:predicted DNA-binding transcriptional regulator AlpA
VQDLLDTPDLATELKASEPTIISWRRLGTGPDFIRVGRMIRYRRTDVDRWLQEHTQRLSPETSD